MKARQQTYMYAFGLLFLRHSELWEITPGELNDLIAANEYKIFRDRCELALQTASILNMFSTRKISVQDLTGIWKNGRILTKEEFFTEWKAEKR